MAIGAGVAALLGAIIAAGATVTTTAVTASQTEDAGDEARRLSGIQRGDILEQQRRERRLQRENLGLSREGLAFQREEATLDRRERTEERAYQRSADRYNRAVQLLNSNQDMQTRLANIWRR